MPARSEPHDGDVVVSRRIVPERCPVYDIRIVPGPPQVSVDDPAQALAQAFEFSQTRGSEVWMQNVGGCTRVRRPRRELKSA